nr:hypothetical protein [uncultured Rhodopila sp.]
MSEQTGDPLDVARRMKFEAVSYHPIDGHPLNLVAQIYQTWTSWWCWPRRDSC